MVEQIKALVFSLLLLLFTYAFHLFNTMWFRPAKLRKKMMKQGISGPPPSFLYGNLNHMKPDETNEEPTEDHDIKAAKPISHSQVLDLFPHLERWKKQYGRNFVYTKRNVVVLCVGEPNLARQVSLYNGHELGKPTYLVKEDEPLLGESIVRSNGQKWHKQRKIIAPEFFMSKIKGMVEIMVSCALPPLEAWENGAETEGGLAEIEVYEDLKKLSADVISKACFGISYAQGEELLGKLRQLAVAVGSSPLHHVPGLNYLPTKAKKKIRFLSLDTESMIKELVQQRREQTTSIQNDFLQRIIEAAEDSSSGIESFDRFVVDNSRTIYLAGQETTAASVAWTLVLLASNPKWQDLARREVREVCRGQVPDADSLSQLKVLTMVIQESMRLYPPTAEVPREVLKDMKIGDVHLPSGLNLSVPILSLHHDVEAWGLDAHEFNPERFSQGVSAACKFPSSYLPFGFGPRVCPGMNLSMTESKIILSLVLSRFTFRLSPNYCHCPTHHITIVPKYGVKLMMQRI